MQFPEITTPPSTPSSSEFEGGPFPTLLHLNKYHDDVKGFLPHDLQQRGIAEKTKGFAVYSVMAESSCHLARNIQHSCLKFNFLLNVIARTVVDAHQDSTTTRRCGASFSSSQDWGIGTRARGWVYVTTGGSWDARRPVKNCVRLASHGLVTPALQYQQHDLQNLLFLLGMPFLFFFLIIPLCNHKTPCPKMVATRSFQQFRS